MVYCGSGTETNNSFMIIKFRILWSTAEAVLRQNFKNKHNCY